jgi:hypothetical protein
VLALVAGLVGTKWLAAEIIGRVWGFGFADRGLMGSLTLPRVAATLAAALAGFQTVNHAGATLIDQALLNTVLVVATSLLGPIMTEQFLRRFPTPDVRTGLSALKEQLIWSLEAMEWPRHF